MPSRSTSLRSPGGASLYSTRLLQSPSQPTRLPDHRDGTAARTMRNALGLVALAFALGGCAADRLSDAVTHTANEIADARNRHLLLNIVRRGQGHPIHFTQLEIVRDRNRANVGADLSLSAGGDAGRRIGLAPFFELERRPQFEISPLNDKAFYRALLAPLALDTIRYFLQQPHRRELVLFLAIDELRLPEADAPYRNDPRDPDAFARFQRALEALVDQGLTAEGIQLVRDVGPAIVSDAAPEVDAIIAAKKEGLVVEEVEPAAAAGRHGGSGGKRAFRMREVVLSTHLCFAAPQTALARAARCGSAAGSTRFQADAPKLFGYADANAAVAAFEAQGLGRIELHTRSLDQIIGYVGELAWFASNAPAAAPAVRVRGARQRLFVLETGPATPRPALVAVDYQGQRHAVPAGPEGELSGEVLAFLGQLLSQAQSIGDRPISRSITLIGD